ncbi:MAG: hypothetical protein QXD24_03780 [Candidatus Caldarchaeum sp.]
MSRRRITEQLLEVLMSSVNSNLVLPELGWRVFEYFVNHQLSSEQGFQILVKACRTCEPEKTRLALRGEFR